MMNDRIAIVTGGLQGIGLAIARELARQGVRVAIGSRRGDEGEASVSDIRGRFPFTTDIRGRFPFTTVKNGKGVMLPYPSPLLS